MKVAYPVSDKILERFRANRGKAMSARDFADFGNRAAVAKALSRLTAQGEIRRIGRGLYEQPRVGRLVQSPIPSSTHEMAEAWARKNNLRLVPSGAYAANLLGLTTQVPARYVYYTNGRSRVLTLGAHRVQLLNRGPRTMEVTGRTAPLVFQALRHLGPKRATPDVIARLQSTLSSRDKAELVRNARHASEWMRAAIEQIIGKVNGDG